MKRFFASALIVLFCHSALAQSDDRFLDNFRSDFPKGCAETASQSGISGEDALALCRCVTDEMIKTLPVSDLRQIAEQQTFTELQKQQILLLGQECRQTYQITPRANYVASAQDPPKEQSGAYRAGRLMGRIFVYILLAFGAWKGIWYVIDRKNFPQKENNENGL